jgi:glycosyltransferase involved in cell wall biosynthesis
MVAIALPVFNGAEHLEEALLSFQRQTYPNFELVICDNASSDATPEIGKRFARCDSRIIYCRQANFMNMRDNFLRAYRLTNPQHKYFLWACDDNVWSPTFLERTVNTMERDPGCSACGFYLHHFGGDDNRKIELRMPRLYKNSRLSHFIFERMSCISIYALMRRCALDQIDLDLPEITDYLERYYLISLRCLGHFNVVEEDLLAFRAGGISSTRDDPWVSTVIDNNFGDRELNLLLSLKRVTWLEKRVLAMKFTYIALRHNIPHTASRLWLLPAYSLSMLMNKIRPSAWKVTNKGLQCCE